MGDLGSMLGGGLMGGDGGGGSTTSTTLATLPSWIQNPIQGITGQVYDLSQQGYNPYGGQRLQGFNQDEQNSFRMMQQLAGSTSLDQSQGISAEVARRGLEGYSQAELDPYMNPYAENVIDSARRKQFEDYDRQEASLRQRAGEANAFGGSRFGLAEAELSSNFQEQMGDFEYKALADNFSQGMNAAQAGTQLAGQTSMDMANLQQAQQQVGLTDINALQASGATQRGMDQAGLDINYQDYLTEQAYPYEQLSWASSLLNPVGSLMRGSTNTQTTQASSGGSGILGTALGIGSMAMGIPGMSGMMGAGMSGLGSSIGGSVGGSMFGAGTGMQAGLSGSQITRMGQGGGQGMYGPGFKDGGIVHKYANGGPIGNLQDPQQEELTNKPASLVQRVDGYMDKVLETTPQQQAEIQPLAPIAAGAASGGGGGGGSAGASGGGGEEEGGGLGSTIGTVLGAAVGSMFGMPTLGASVGGSIGGSFAEGGVVTANQGIQSLPNATINPSLIPQPDTQVSGDQMQDFWKQFPAPNVVIEENPNAPTGQPMQGSGQGLPPKPENKPQQNPAYLDTIAHIESSGNPQAVNADTGAAGLFQFMPKTAEQYKLTDPHDVMESTRAAEALTRDNAKVLSKSLKRVPTEGELYLAHQQGATGASKLLKNPTKKAIDVVGEKQVTLNGGTKDMTAAEFAGLWVNKYDSTRQQLTNNAYADGGIIGGIQDFAGSFGNNFTKGANTLYDASKQGLAYAGGYDLDNETGKPIMQEPSTFASTGERIGTGIANIPAHIGNSFQSITEGTGNAIHSLEEKINKPTVTREQALDPNTAYQTQTAGDLRALNDAQTRIGAAEKAKRQGLANTVPVPSRKPEITQAQKDVVQEVQTKLKQDQMARSVGIPTQSQARSQPASAKEDGMNYALFNFGAALLGSDKSFFKALGEGAQVYSATKRDEDIRAQEALGAQAKSDLEARKFGLSQYNAETNRMNAQPSPFEAQIQRAKLDKMNAEIKAMNPNASIEKRIDKFATAIIESGINVDPAEAYNQARQLVITGDVMDNTTGGGKSVADPLGLLK